jgi:biopolymer transport protein ExbD
MAEIADSGGGDHGKGKKRPKKGNTRVDMTPMVDLAFLLLTFFVLTSTFSTPKVMNLAYPAKPDETVKDEPQKINNAVTFLLSENKIYYYFNEFHSTPTADGKPATVLLETNFGPGPKGVRALLADKNSSVIQGKKRLKAELKTNAITEAEYLERYVELKKAKSALKVLIKTDDKALCKNFIDLIDELKINDIGVMAPVDILASEYDMLNAKLLEK